MTVFVADEAVHGVCLISLTQPGIAVDTVGEVFIRCDSPGVEVADSVGYARTQAGEVVAEEAGLVAFIKGWMVQKLVGVGDFGAAVCAVTEGATHEAVGGGGV